MSPGMNAEQAEREVRIPTSGMTLSGTLGLPRGASGIVLFAHGSGSGRFSPRNQFVAESLQRVGLGTLLIDLLGDDEAGDRRKVFDIELLAGRLLAAALWLGHEPATRSLRLGYFGASTGAAAALVAAARRPKLAGAVVSRGGRPDLARGDLPDVMAPTLLIVGGLDEDVLELNRQALALLRCPRELVVVPGATHLFPEPGTLEEVARLAEQWFLRHLGSASQPPRDRPVTTGERIPQSDMDDQS
jgi:putative phosphoribosyl transferase